jgi:DNA integrity scanning protein DisA with diadenylate cyclase activity
MRRITAIPSKKIAFKNVPVAGLFFCKRTLYQKISNREANAYNEQLAIYFESQKIVRFVAKQHESAAVEAYSSHHSNDTDDVNFEINDSVEIIDKNTLGKIVSVNKRSCLVQYKDDGTVTFNEFDFDSIKKVN